jgi:hypothetical protein
LLAAGNRDRRAAAERFVKAWGRSDLGAMLRALTPRARGEYPQGSFAAAYRRADRAAGVRWVSIARLADDGGGFAVAVKLGTDARSSALQGASARRENAARHA